MYLNKIDNGLSINRIFETSQIFQMFQILLVPTFVIKVFKNFISQLCFIHSNERKQA